MWAAVSTPAFLGFQTPPGSLTPLPALGPQPTAKLSFLRTLEENEPLLGSQQFPSLQKDVSSLTLIPA